MISQDLKKLNLPDWPGVYLFKAKRGILYIGKATSLRDRIKSYFSKDLTKTRGQFLVDMVFKANRVDFIKTESVLEAIILESNLIKKYQPKYNTKEKDDKSFNYVVITKEDWPRVLIMRGKDLEHQKKSQSSVLPKNIFGPFINGTQLKEALKIVRKIFPFRDKCEPLSGKPCFNRQIGLCPGVCDGTITKSEYRKIVRNIILFFQAKKNLIIKGLEKEMKFLAKSHEFEKAGKVRNQIFALGHIRDVALIKDQHITKDESNFRIEAYDAAHLSGTNNVGVMVVMENSEYIKSAYRKFKINNSKGNDTEALKEVLERRLKHTEWPLPDFIVVDGGLAQLNAANAVIGNIQVITVTKDDKHKPKAIIGNENIVRKYKKDILAVNAEAHRFAIAFHRQKRNVIL